MMIMMVVTVMAIRAIMMMMMVMKIGGWSCEAKMGDWSPQTIACC